MKKKMIALWMVLSVVAATATGCGKAGKSAEEMQQEADMQYIADSIDAAHAADQAMKEEGEKAEAERETLVSTFKKYPKDPGWANTKLDEQPIQIDDVLFKNGECLGDVMERFAASDVDYEYNYEPEKLVLSHGYENIGISREGVGWIVLTVQNLWDQSAPLKELPIIEYRVWEEAIPFIYILDGKCEDDYLAMTYTTIQQDPVLSKYEFNEGTESKDMSDVIWLNFSNYESGDDEISSIHWTGYEINSRIHYKFLVDPNTQQVIKMLPLETKASGAMPLTDDDQVNSGDWAPPTSLSRYPDAVDDIAKKGEGIVCEDLEVDHADYLGYLLAKDGWALFLYQLPDKRVTYIGVGDIRRNNETHELDVGGIVGPAALKEAGTEDVVFDVSDDDSWIDEYRESDEFYEVEIQ